MNHSRCLETNYINYQIAEQKCKMEMCFLLCLLMECLKRRSKEVLQGLPFSADEWLLSGNWECLSWLLAFVVDDNAISTKDQVNRRCCDCDSDFVLLRD
ncbi:hypothetical protein Dimus_005500 [Dionaea muscipula]